MISVKKTDSNFEREILAMPFGFKGGYLNELWQIIVSLQNKTGTRALGLGVQSVLWSDPDIFSHYSQAAANSCMFLLTEYALNKAKTVSYDSPIDLLDQLLPEVYDYGKKITCHKNLRMTFALNALVAVDNSAWLLYAKENNINSFDELLPEGFREPFSCRQKELACIPLITYGVDLNDVRKAVDDGYFFLKIKIGSDPEKDGCLDKMLKWDKKRLEDIHNTVGHIKIPYTKNGRIPYYLDANGRYDSKERLIDLLEFADKINALDRIILLEEPFPEEYIVDVSDVPVRLAADESAHSDIDVIERISQGYKAVALKPIAKTMSMSLKIAKIAHQKNIPCFCADLTVNPVLVDWNKNVAARLEPLPGMKTGVLESNGHQNYLNWKNMLEYHPCCDFSWTKTVNGVYQLSKDFYDMSGGIFEESTHYSQMVKNG